MSDNTLGGMIGSLLGRRNSEDVSSSNGFTKAHRMLGGALLAAGAAYLYKRYKSGNLNVPGLNNNNGFN